MCSKDSLYNLKSIICTLIVHGCSPINLVYENKDRWVYAAVFGALSGTFVQLIFGGDIVNPQSFVESIFQGMDIHYTSNSSQLAEFKYRDGPIPVLVSIWYQCQYQ